MNEQEESLNSCQFLTEIYRVTQITFEPGIFNLVFTDMVLEQKRNTEVANSGTLAEVRLGVLVTLFLQTC